MSSIATERCVSCVCESRSELELLFSGAGVMILMTYEPKKRADSYCECEFWAVPIPSEKKSRGLEYLSYNNSNRDLSPIQSVSNPPASLVTLQCHLPITNLARKINPYTISHFSQPHR